MSIVTRTIIVWQLSLQIFTLNRPILYVGVVLLYPKELTTNTAVVHCDMKCTSDGSAQYLAPQDQESTLGLYLGPIMDGSHPIETGSCSARNCSEFKWSKFVNCTSRAQVYYYSGLQTAVIYNNYNSCRQSAVAWQTTVSWQHK